MSDIRDSNHDGKVSLMEKVKDKLHLHGHKDATTTHATTSHHTTAAGALPLAGGAHGFNDSRDLNRDGHISTTEKLASGSHTSAFNDSRDLNRDGHISTSEKLAGSHMSAGHHAAGFQSDEARLRLHEEQLAVSKREVGAGEVDIHKRVQQEHVQQTIPVRREEVTIERRPLTGAADPNARIAAQDETVRVPLHREEILTEKRIVPTEEVIVRKKDIMDNQTVGATLRSEFVETMQTGGAFDARDTNRDGHVSMGEKFQKTGHGDARDLNRDGHVSMGEKLKSQSAYGDSRDTNRDGHVSMGEKLKGAAAGKAARG
jgi:uncharacterized protein (TIGR02271 family)